MMGNGGGEDRAMRQELIEEALGLLAMGDWPRLTRLGHHMTEQEKIYAEGIIQDMLDDVPDTRGCMVTMWRRDETRAD
jgi:hypothetical protein